MSLFGRKGSDKQFWLVPPIPSRDPQALRQFGNTCVGREDHRQMIATGWTLWNLVGLDKFQADDFVSDGYSGWKRGASFVPQLGLEFATQYFERARRTAVAIDGGKWVHADVWSMSPDVVGPGATAYGAMCFAGCEVLELAALVGDTGLRQAHEKAMFAAVAETNRNFVPPRTLEWFTAYADTHGLAKPW